MKRYERPAEWQDKSVKMTRERERPEGEETDTEELFVRSAVSQPGYHFFNFSILAPT